MNKYLLVRPSDFWYFGEVDLEGEYPHIKANDFKVNEKFNYLMFEINCKRNSKGVIVYSELAKELFTGEEFSFKMIGNEDKKVKLSSDTLGLYSDIISFKDIACQPSKISGIVNHMKEDVKLLSKYKFDFESLTEASRFYKGLHDETVNGLSRRSKRELRRCFKYQG